MLKYIELMQSCHENIQGFERGMPHNACDHSSGLTVLQIFP